MNEKLRERIRGAAQSRGSKSRENAVIATELWYAEMRYLGRARVAPYNADDTLPVPDVPDEYVRSQTFIGPSAARPDYATAHGVETKPSGRSSIPYGVASRIDVVREDVAQQIREDFRVRDEAVTLVMPAMMRLGLIEPAYAWAVELRCAGYPFQPMATVLEVSKPLAHQFYECGLTWIAGCLIVKPDFRAGIRTMPRQGCRSMTWSDLTAESITPKSACIDVTP